MARLDRARMSAGIYPFEVEVQTRFSDTDVLKHLNNVAIAEISQEGRTRFAHGNDLINVMEGYGLVVASIQIEYAEEMRHPAPVHISMGMFEVGRSSYRAWQLLRQNGRICSYAEIVQVANKDGAAAPFSDVWRAKLEALKIKFPD